MKVTVVQEGAPFAFDIPDASTWPAYLKVPEAAAIMRVSKMTVYRLIHSGDLVTTRVGRGFRIDSASLEAYLKKGEVDAG